MLQNNKDGRPNIILDTFIYDVYKLHVHTLGLLMFNLTFISDRAWPCNTTDLDNTEHAKDFNTNNTLNKLILITKKKITKCSEFFCSCS